MQQVQAYYYLLGGSFQTATQTVKTKRKKIKTNDHDNDRENNQKIFRL